VHKNFVKVDYSGVTVVFPVQTVPLQTAGAGFEAKPEIPALHTVVSAAKVIPEMAWNDR
jgi:hypothetical protein